MKAWSVIGLLFAAMIFAMVPISPQVTPRGVELSVDQAQAITYRRARVTARRVERRAYRSAAYAVGAGAVGYGVGRTTAAMVIRPTPHRPHRLTELAMAMGRITAATAIHPTAMLATAIRLMAMAAITAGLRIARRVAIHRARWR